MVSQALTLEKSRVGAFFALGATRKHFSFERRLVIVAKRSKEEQEEDKKEWGDFIEKQGLENWINAWDPYNQSGFRLFYDIRSTPSIYLLDRGKKIIAKRIDVETLEKVLEDEYARKDKNK